MATCQGQAYLEQQLHSIEKQSYPRWVLYVSDDGSLDKTVEILQGFKQSLEQTTSGSAPWTVGSSEIDLTQPVERHSRVRLFDGPKMGSTENFMHLLRLVAKEAVVLDTDLVAFADQDDVWLPQKLERAVSWHLSATTRMKNTDRNDQESPSQTEQLPPCLYASRSLLVDEDLKVMGLSRLPKGPLDFSLALVENVLSGNTMVMNKRLMEILSSMQVAHSVWHDWSAFLVTTGCGGELYFDREPSVLYRQHASNVIGVKKGFLEQCIRWVAVLKGRYKAWTQINLNGLNDIEIHLVAEPLHLKRAYESMRSEKSLWRRCLKVRHLSIRRQGLFLQIALYFALVLGLV